MDLSDEKKKSQLFDKGALESGGKFPYFFQEYGIPRDYKKTKERRKSNYQTARDFLLELAKFNNKYQGLRDITKQRKKQIEVQNVIRKILRGE